jgi:hypothetical protein
LTTNFHVAFRLHLLKLLAELRAVREYPLKDWSVSVEDGSTTRAPGHLGENLAKIWE